MKQTKLSQNTYCCVYNSPQKTFEFLLISFSRLPYTQLSHLTYAPHSVVFCRLSYITITWYFLRRLVEYKRRTFGKVSVESLYLTSLCLTTSSGSVWNVLGCYQRLRNLTSIYAVLTSSPLGQGPALVYCFWVHLSKLYYKEYPYLTN